VIDDLVKIVFSLQQDEDGYPPVAKETVWARENADGHYVIDNIPFFTREATLGDVVQAVRRDGRLHYASTVGDAGNSLLRVVPYKGTDPDEIRRHLEGLGCSVEKAGVFDLISVNVPPTVKLTDVQSMLARGAAEEKWGYEEPLLRQ
jgi:hypothetical protein